MYRANATFFSLHVSGIMYFMPSSVAPALGRAATRLQTFPLHGSARCSRGGGAGGGPRRRGGSGRRECTVPRPRLMPHETYRSRGKPQLHPSPGALDEYSQPTAREDLTLDPKSPSWPGVPGETRFRPAIARSSDTAARETLALGARMSAGESNFGLYN